METIAKYSPKDFYELRIFYLIYSDLELFLEELEHVLISWANRIPQKSLSLIIINKYHLINLKIKKENMKMIKKFKKLDFIKKWKIN